MLYVILKLPPPALSSSCVKDDWLELYNVPYVSTLPVDWMVNEPLVVGVNSKYTICPPFVMLTSYVCPLFAI